MITKPDFFTLGERSVKFLAGKQAGLYDRNNVDSHFDEREKHKKIRKVIGRNKRCLFIRKERKI